jgi:hypothetical protein
MMNYPLQAGGADYMRVVLIAATEAGLWVCCVVHDGFMIMARTEEIEAAVATMLMIMKAAGELLYGEAAIVKCDQIVHWPNCFDPGLNDEERELWGLIVQTVLELEAAETASQAVA